MAEGILNFIKVVVTILLLPLVYAGVMGLYPHLEHYPENAGEFFGYGAAGFLLIFLFVYQFWGIYEAGRKIVGSMFAFAVPFDKFLSNSIPFFTTVILLVLFIVRRFLNHTEYTHYFIFFAGFTLAMHVLLTAQDLQSQEEGVFRPGYFFNITLAVLINCVIVILLLDLVFERFTLIKFINQTYGVAMDLYQQAFRLLAHR